MDRVIITRPFVEGVNLDLPDYLLRPRQASALTDAIAPRGVIMQRKGWEYDGAAQVVASDLVSFWRANYLLADVTRTTVTAENGNIYIHNGGSGGTNIGTGTTNTLARCQYRDETLFCHQDGLSPLFRYSGSDLSANVTLTGTQSFGTTGDSHVTFGGGGSFSTNPGIGAYFMPDYTTAARDLQRWYRILESSTTSVTVENAAARSGAETLQANASIVEPFGFAFPCVSIYEAGAATYDQAALTITGYGTKWSTGGITLRTSSVSGNDGIMIVPATGDSAMFRFGTVSTDTLLSVVSAGSGTTSITVRSPYHIVRRMPFKDVAAHRDCLWGTGVAFHPNRLYVGPPGWDITGPPGEQLPFDLTRLWTTEARRDFLMDTIDVPSPFDGDYIVAILHTDQGLGVCKRGGFWMVDGVYPTFTTRLVDPDATCIDIRGAQNLPSGPVWVGERGAFIWRNGRVINMMAGTVADYWAANFGTKITTTDAYVTVGEVDGHIRVSARNDSAETIVLVFDAKTGVWLGNHSNQACRNYFSSQEVTGEPEELYGIGDGFQGRPIKLSSVTNDRVLVERDGNGTKPVLIASTGTNMTPEIIDEERKLIDLAVTANVYDGGAVGSTVLRVSHVSGGSLRANADENTILDSIPSDSVNRVDRYYIRRVNKNGRYHKLSFTVTTFDTDAHANGASVEISEIAMTFAPTAERS